MIHKKSRVPFLLLVLLFAASGCGPQPAVGQEASASVVPTDLPPSPTPMPATPTQVGNGLVQLTTCQAQCLQPAWLDGNQISYFSIVDGRFHIVDLKGQDIRTFTLPEITAETAWSPDLIWSPNGKQMAFTVNNKEQTQTNLVVHTALNDSSRAIFSTPAWISHVSWAQDGQSVYFVMGKNELLHLGPKAPIVMMIDIETSETEKIFTLPAEATDIAVSPDGGQVVYVSKEGLSLLKAGESQAAVLARDGGSSPAWSPDGRRIAFVSTPKDAQDAHDSELYVINVDGTGLAQWTDHRGYVERQPVWSPDGRCLVFTAESLTADGSIAGDDQVYKVCN